MDRLFLDMEKAGIQLPSHWPVDHLCYRVDSLVRFDIIKNDFARFGRLLAETPVGGRPIATFKLAKPVVYRNYRIDVVEVPAPKRGKVVAEGFEHIEVVCDVPLTELENQYSHLTLDKGGLAKALNPELEICLGVRNLKFHPLSLEAVINIESNQSLKK